MKLGGSLDDTSGGGGGTTITRITKYVDDHWSLERSVDVYEVEASGSISVSSDEGDGYWWADAITAGDGQVIIAKKADSMDIETIYYTVKEISGTGGGTTTHSHTWNNGICSGCGTVCTHAWISGTCTTCGKSCTHTWSNGICTTCGTQCSHPSYDTNNKCTVCGVAKPGASTCTHPTTEVIPAVEATCTKTGLTAGKACVVCGEILTAQQITQKLPHTEVVDDGKVATCTATGLTEGKHCSVCGEVLVKQEIIPVIPHTEVVDAAIEATCDTSGWTEGKHCSVCGKTTVKQIFVAAKGHNYSDSGYCTVCGRIDPLKCNHEKNHEDPELGYVCDICGAIIG